MDSTQQERQRTIRRLMNSAPPELLRAVLERVLETTAEAQEGPDIGSYGRGGCLPTEVVDAEYEGRNHVGDDVDSEILSVLKGE
ncbi:hypothetical protein [Streptomyces nanshensis]|uniref:Uncharacterized protein n=1 Tax=Streptomyces nanshensis TaxID=518642 RepID=A0A1E7LC56_9ACTN|nr:hypothetical protein [Streptomyces nanshensis]OEV13812.1 hypothetical protein AN218_01895 [Streptomyces nanshensis]